MFYTNFEMANMVESLKPILKHRDIIGYAAARNTRILEDCLTEFRSFQEDLVRKYGTQDKTEDGKDLPTIRLEYSDPKFKEFSEELEKIGNIKHNAFIMVLDYKDVIGLLNGEEILAIDWMLKDNVGSEVN